MSSDELVSKLSQSGIPESSRKTIINCIIKHLMDSDESEDKGSTNNRVASEDAAVLERVRIKMYKQPYQI